MLTPHALDAVGRIVAALRRRPMRQTDAGLQTLARRARVTCEGRPCSACTFALLRLAFAAGLVVGVECWQLGVPGTGDYLAAARGTCRRVRGALALLGGAVLSDDGVLEAEAEARIAAVAAVPGRAVAAAIASLRRRGAVVVTRGAA